MSYRNRPIYTLYMRGRKHVATGRSCTINTAIIAAIKKSYRYTSAQICNGHGIMRAEVVQSKDGTTTIRRRFKW